MTQLIRAWQRRVEDPSQVGRRAYHFAAVTECFMEVVYNHAVGGTRKGTQAGNMAICAWMAAVFTAMVHVEGDSPLV